MTSRTVNLQNPISLFLASAVKCKEDGVINAEEDMVAVDHILTVAANARSAKEYVDLIHDLRMGARSLINMRDDDKTYEMCRASVENDRTCHNLQWVPTHLKTKALIEKAFSVLDGRELSYIRFADSLRNVPLELISQELLFSLVRKYPKHIFRLPDELKTKELCDAAVETCGLVLWAIPNRLITKELCTLAVSNRCGSALRDVPEHLKSVEMCELAVTSHPPAKVHFFDVLVHVPYELLTSELCAMAVNTSGACLKDVPFNLRTKELCEAAFANYGNVLGSIPEDYRTHEICQLALTKDPTALKYVPFITSDICEVAVYHFPEALRYVPNRFKTKRLCESAVD